MFASQWKDCNKTNSSLSCHDFGETSLMYVFGPKFDVTGLEAFWFVVGTYLKRYKYCAIQTFLISSTYQSLIIEYSDQVMMNQY